MRSTEARPSVLFPYLIAFFSLSEFDLLCVCIFKCILFLVYFYNGLTLRGRGGEKEVRPSGMGTLLSFSLDPGAD